MPARSQATSAILATLLATVACGAAPESAVLGFALERGSRAAVMLAVEEINSTGGIGSVPLKIEGLDWSASDEPAEHLEHARRLAEKETVLAVIGHADSSSVLAAAPLYNSRGVPNITTIATNEAISHVGPWTYRLCVPDSVLGPALAEHAVRQWGKRRMVMIYVNDDYGLGMARSFQEHATALGATMVATYYHRNHLTGDDKHGLRRFLRRTHEAENPDLVVLFQHFLDAADTLPLVRQELPGLDVLGGDNLGISRTSPRWGEYLEGVRAPQFYMPSNLDASQRFEKAFLTLSGGRTPDYADALTYDAVHLLATAVVRNGASRAGIRRYLEQLARSGEVVHGVAGDYRMGRDRNAVRAITIVEFTADGFRPVSRTDAADS